jgi:hypothetical protein
MWKAIRRNNINLRPKRYELGNIYRKEVNKMNNVEMWKPIEGFEGRYEVSNLGRIKSLNYNHTGKEGFLK